jgi:protein-tyrosine phosphatase
LYDNIVHRYLSSILMSTPPVTPAQGAPAAAPATARVIPTTGIHNFRDYGGYAAAGLGRVAWMRLYRSGEHVGATARDLEIVGTLGLAAVIDLRGTSERAAAPTPASPNSSIPVICTDGETAPAPHEAAATALGAAEARRNMIEGYSRFPLRSRLGDVYRRYFALLAETTGPTLVNCVAGKDRTGFLVALLHHALGVHHDDIFEDYLLTNTAGDPAARVAALRRDLVRHFGAPMSDEAVNVVVSVEPRFLQAAFDSAIARYGSIDTYLAEVLGVTAQVREALIERLVS